MSALDRPVRTLTVYDGQPNHRAHAVSVRPSDVLAALDANARGAMRDRIAPVIAAGVSGVPGAVPIPDDFLIASAVVDAICGEAGP